MDEHEGLKVWMASVRMTRQELAKSLGYSSNLLWRILGGSRSITDSFRWRFGAVYGFGLAERVLGLNIPDITADSEEDDPLVVEAQRMIDEEGDVP